MKKCSLLSPSKRRQFSALAVLCLASGFLLILDNIGVLNGIWKFWPVFPLFLGFGGAFFFKKGGKVDAKGLGIGTFLILVSIFFFVLNFTSWKLVAKLWPAFIGMLGFSIITASHFTAKKRWFAISGLFFIFLALIFFIVFTVNAKLWPISLILFGIWIFVLPERNDRES